MHRMSKLDNITPEELEKAENSAVVQWSEEIYARPKDTFMAFLAGMALSHYHPEYAARLWESYHEQHRMFCDVEPDCVDLFGAQLGECVERIKIDE